MLTEKQLDDIAWRAGRGCHYEGVFLHGSNYAKQVIQNDVPLLIVEIRRLQAAQQGSHPTAAGVSQGDDNSESGGG
jgi:hypothetical protein